MPPDVHMPISLPNRRGAACLWHKQLHLYSCQIALWSGSISSIFFHYRILFCQSGVKWYLTVVLNGIVLRLDILCLFSPQIFCSVNCLSRFVCFFFSFNSVICVCLLVFESSPVFCRETLCWLSVSSLGPWLGFSLCF